MAGFCRIILQFFAIFTLLLCYVLRPKDKFWPIFPPHTMSIPMEFLLNQSINKIGNILRNSDGSEWSLVSDHCRTFPKFPPPRVHKSRTSKSVRNICGHFFTKKRIPLATTSTFWSQIHWQWFLLWRSSYDNKIFAIYIDIDIVDSGFMVNNVKQ